MSKNHKWLKRNSNHFKHAHNNFHIFFLILFASLAKLCSSQKTLKFLNQRLTHANESSQMISNPQWQINFHQKN